MTSTLGDSGSVSPPLKTHSSASAIHEYEFRAAESAVIGSLGSKMSFVGLFMVGIGLSFVISTILRWSRHQEIDVGLIFLTLLFMIFGIWTHRAGREFRGVAASHGHDVSHLMAALANLLNLYSLVYLIFFIALIFAFIQLAAQSLGG